MFAFAQVRTNSRRVTAPLHMSPCLRGGKGSTKGVEPKALWGQSTIPNTRCCTQTILGANTVPLRLHKFVGGLYPLTRNQGTINSALVSRQSPCLKGEHFPFCEAEHHTAAMK